MLSVSDDPFNPKVKGQILLSYRHTFLTADMLRS